LVFSQDDPLSSYARDKGLNIVNHNQPSRDLATSIPCGTCFSEGSYYCRPKTDGLYFDNNSGECLEEYPDPIEDYYCQDYIHPLAADKYWRYFVCNFETNKCGDDRILYMDKKVQTVTISGLNDGEACAYELQYSEGQMNDDYKVWFTLL
jgi:hypothetical protein